MDDIILARAIHVLAVLVWIGGVAFVTLVVMPSVRAANPPAERLAAVHRLASRIRSRGETFYL